GGVVGARTRGLSRGGRAAHARYGRAHDRDALLRAAGGDPRAGRAPARADDQRCDPLDRAGATAHRCRRRVPGTRGGLMEIDIFTLFPEWFDWLLAQRHVANVLAAGTRIECVDFRPFTPLSGGQVDDTPFGG